jgi:MobA/VirD2-like, nuclease domain
VIGKVLRGERVVGLIYYLYGPGRHEEHTDPHIVAGWRHPTELEPPLRPGGRRDFRLLNGLLQQTLTALGDRAPNRPVWHCVARAAPTDRMLSDGEWAQVASEIMQRTGFAPAGQDDTAVRWVAIRHADDHIHIVATLARQDGGQARVSNDYYRVREACLAAEQRFGLRRTAPGDRTAAHRPTRAESEKAHRRGWREAPRVTLKLKVSTAATAAGSEEDFFTRLERAGVLIRKRFSTRNPSEVTGYAVALPDDTASEGGHIWYSGGKLAADLTLPKLRRRWHGDLGASHTTPSAPTTAAERVAIWDHATHVAGQAAAQIRDLTAAGDPGAAADAAWAAADTLHAAAAALNSRVIRQAASNYDRAARMPYGRIPRPTQAGTNLRRTARLLSTAAFATHDRTLAQTALIARLAALADAVSELRAAQRHSAQATAAHHAAEHLRCAAHSQADAIVQIIANARPANDLAGEAFPRPPRPPQPGGSRRGARDSPAAGARPRPRPTRSRGPGR